MKKYDEVLSEEDVETLTDKVKSRSLLKQDYPVLMMIDPGKNKRDQIYMSGNYRYYANKKCCIKGIEYFYTSQLYGYGDATSHGDNRTPLWTWVCKKMSVNIDEVQRNEALPEFRPQQYLKERGEDELSPKVTIEKINKYISTRGSSYNDILISNFYLSIKSKPFVILAGISGTGKTRLIRLFAEAVGATKENGRYLQVAVRPDWSDSSDLFGHVNLNGDFVPGKILVFIKKANENPKQPYFLCLDEMNLARVEYYMSDFLSVIETRDLNEAGEIETDLLMNISDYGEDKEGINRK